jgi:hypothetical protein
MAAQRELRQIGQKEEFLFCLHFIGYKIQTLARRQEFKSNWPKKKMFCLHFIGDKNQTLGARRREFESNRPKRTKKLFLFCLHFIGEKINHWHGGAN